MSEVQSAGSAPIRPPVFVDVTGRRPRIVKAVLVVCALTCAAFLLVVGMSVTASQSSPMLGLAAGVADRPVVADTHSGSLPLAQPLPAESLPAEPLPAESLPAESRHAESLNAESLNAESLNAESLKAKSPAAEVPLAQPLVVRQAFAPRSASDDAAAVAGRAS